jgi:hypothetical protein
MPAAGPPSPKTDAAQARRPEEDAVPCHGDDTNLAVCESQGWDCGSDRPGAGGLDFSSQFASLRGGPYASVAAAKAAGAPPINYGIFINTIIDFVIAAFVLFS